MTSFKKGLIGYEIAGYFHAGFIGDFENRISWDGIWDFWLAFMAQVTCVHPVETTSFGTSK